MPFQYAFMYLVGLFLKSFTTDRKSFTKSFMLPCNESSFISFPNVPSPESIFNNISSSPYFEYNDGTSYIDFAFNESEKLMKQYFDDNDK